MRVRMKRMFKKSLLTVLICCFIVPQSIAWANTATDITGHWAEPTLSEWLEQGYISGYEDGTVRPNQGVTRAEFLSFVNRVFAFNRTGEISFSDVKENDWYYENIAIAVEAGLMNGYSDGTFRPNQIISREEIATVVGRLLALSEMETGSRFSDAEAIANWAIGHVGSVREHGILTGYPDGSYQPSQLATRAEAVIVLERALQVQNGVVQYVQAGVFGPDDSTMTIDGDVVITVSDVSLQNVVITGNLHLTEQIGEGDVFLSHVTVEGETTIEGGGSESIHITDSTFKSVKVNKRNGSVRLAFRGSSSVDRMSLHSSARINRGDEQTNISVNELELPADLPEGSEIDVEGDIDVVNVASSNSQLNLNSGRINELNVSEGSEGNDIVVGTDAAVEQAVISGATNIRGEGIISAANINVDGVDLDIEPESLTVQEGVSATIKGEQKTSANNTVPTPPVATVPGPVVPSPGPVTPTPTPDPDPSPEAGVSGTVKFIGEDEYIQNGWLIVHRDTEEGWERNHIEVKDGKFSRELPDGEYVLYAFEYVENDRFRYHIMNPVDHIRVDMLENQEDIIVVDGEFVTDIEFEVPRLYEVAVSIQYEDGSPYAASSYTALNYSLEGYDFTQGRELQHLNDDFVITLPAESFEFMYFNPGYGPRILLDPALKLDVSTTNKNELVITIPRPNVIGSVSSDELTEAELNRLSFTVMSESDQFYNIFTINGEIQAYLPEDEKYTIFSYSYFDETDYMSSHAIGKIEFEIIGDQISDLGEIEVFRLHKVNIELEHGRDQEVSNWTMRVQGKEDYTYLFNNDHAVLHLPEGDYHIIQVYVAGHPKEIEIGLDFTVQEGVPSSVTIDLSDYIQNSNVFGSLKLNDGSAFNESYEVRIINQYDSADYYDVSVKNGEFDVYLADGEYVLDGYYSQVTEGYSNYVRLEKKFTVEAGESDDLEIVLNRIHVQFEYVGEAGEEVDGGRLYYQIPFSTQAWHAVSFVGDSFDFYYPDGELLLTHYYLNNGNENNMNETLELANNDQNYVIELNASNVYGTIRGLDELDLSEGSMRVSAHYLASGYTVHFNSLDAHFNFYIPQTGEYELRVVYYYDDDRPPVSFYNHRIYIDAESEKLDIDLLYYKVDIEVIDDNATLGDNYEIEILTADGSAGHIFNVYDNQLSVYLPAGEYSIHSLFEYNAEHNEISSIYELEEPITITVSEDGEKSINIIIE